MQAACQSAILAEVVDLEETTEMMWKEGPARPFRLRDLPVPQMGLKKRAFAQTDCEFSVSERFLVRA
jgi:hypothetical protein